MDEIHQVSEISIEPSGPEKNDTPLTNFRPFVEGEENLVKSGHYTGILPIDDKKSNMINQCIANFEKNLFGDHSEPNFDYQGYNNFIKILKICLSALDREFKVITYRKQGEYVAACLLVIVCGKLNIKHIIFQQSFKPIDNGIFKKVKVSALRKTKAYLSLQNAIN